MHVTKQAIFTAENNKRYEHVLFVRLYAETYDPQYQTVFSTPSESWHETLDGRRVIIDQKSWTCEIDNETFNIMGLE